MLKFLPPLPAQATLEKAIAAFKPICERFAAGEISEKDLYVERDLLVRSLRVDLATSGAFFNPRFASNGRAGKIVFTSVRSGPDALCGKRGS